MRDNGPITANEVLLPGDAVLVSQTDTGGRITFANDAFVRISGFSREELIGSPHNLVRHPHMPKAAFFDLWETVKAGHPWEGLVKNRTKCGDFYWVRANVTPVIEAGQLNGFISIRTRAEPAEIAQAEALYAAIRDGRAQGIKIRGGSVVRTGLGALCNRLLTGIGSGIAINLGILYMAVAASLSAGALGIGISGRALALTGVAVLVVFSTMLSLRRMRRSFLMIEDQFAALSSGDLRRPIESVNVPELRIVSRFLRTLRAKQAYSHEERAQRDRDTMLARAEELRRLAGRIEAVANQTGDDVAATTASMSVNVTGMAEAAGAVRQHAEAAANAATVSLSSAQTVSAAAEELAVSIREIANRVAGASDVTHAAVSESGAAEHAISQLRTEVARIGQIVSLIADIAGQTNLLALNATIEAARAGDAGKGFAVVAAEVKKLASQTAQATEDISKQISQIQRATTETVEAVARIGGKVGEIDQVSAAIAAAVEQQAAATQEISRSVAQAAEAARSVSEIMEGVVRIAAETNDKAAQLRADSDTLAAGTDKSRRTLIETVRHSVSDVERRVYQRVSTDMPCTLVIDGIAHDGRVADISEGGARVAIAAQCAAGATGELRIPSLRVSVDCRVVADNERADKVSVAFAQSIELPFELRRIAA